MILSPQLEAIPYIPTCRDRRRGVVGGERKMLETHVVDQGSSGGRWRKMEEDGERMEGKGDGFMEG